MESPLEGEVLFDSTDMRRIGARPALQDYLRDLWHSRHFVLFDSSVRLSVTHAHTLLGTVWLILNPLLSAITFWLIFGLLLRVGHGIPNFIGYVLLGMATFTYSSRAIVSGARSIASGRSLIRGFTFPRAALPLSLNIREMMSQVWVLLTTLVFIVLVPPVEPMSWRWLLLIPILLLQTLLNWGLGMLLAPLVNTVPDVANLLNFGMRLLMYASGLFYDPARFLPSGPLLAVFESNPFYQVLQMARECVLYDRTPSLDSWLIFGGTAVVVAVVGLVVFWFNEESYARER